MKPRFYVLLLAASAWAAMDGLQATTQRAFAQSSSGSSRHDGESRDHDRDRGRFGERSRGDWRSSRSRRDDEHRGEERRSEERSSSNGSSSSGSSSSNSSSRSTSSSTPSTSSTTTPSSSSRASTNLDLKKWATALVAKNDKNGDMILQPDEQKALGSSATAEDLNHDGMITVDEIVMHHSAGATTAAASAPASAATSTASTGSDSGKSEDHNREHFRGGGYGHHDGGSGSDSQSKINDALAKRVLTGTAGGIGKDADKRHSYRFSKATDKLPTGLPSWFSSRDANKDGQVSMSEYSRSVSESTVAEFRRYDTNDDGMITAKEAAKK